MLLTQSWKRASSPGYRCAARAARRGRCRRPAAEGKLEIQIPYAALRYVLALTDSAFILPPVGGQCRVPSFLQTAPRITLIYPWTGTVSALFMFNGQSVGFYDLRSVSRTGGYQQIFAQWALVSLLLTLLAFLMKIGAGFSGFDRLLRVTGLVLLFVSAR